MKSHRASSGAPSKLGGLVRRRRELARLSMRDAARRIGISPSYLAALEQGRNPSTGRAPVPSPPILAAIARELEIDLATILDAAGAPTSPSNHVLLYQKGAGWHSPLEAARLLVPDAADSWIEIVDPRTLDTIERPDDDVLLRVRRPLSPAPRFEADIALEALSTLVAPALHAREHLRFGLVFGANSATLRSVENPHALLASETSWEDDVQTTLRESGAIEPVANICVYREVDLQELAGRLDPLATALKLIQTHPHVAVQDESGALTTGQAALEAILATTRPAGASAETWEALSRAAASGFARAAMVAHGSAP